MAENSAAPQHPCSCRRLAAAISCKVSDSKSLGGEYERLRTHPLESGRRISFSAFLHFNFSGEEHMYKYEFDPNIASAVTRHGET